VEKSRQEYRENARKLVAENEALQTAVNQVSTREIRREGERERQNTLQDFKKTI
jgi:hypothetical protein